MAVFFHSDDVDEFLELTDAVRLAEDGLRKIPGRQGINAPRERLNPPAIRRGKLRHRA
jgi:hypothetical protein